MQMRCDKCERTFETHADSMDAAREVGRLNGWSVGETVQCPSCASTGTAWSARNAWA